MAEPIRVLLIAEACNPTWTSVPLVGYNMARALAARPDPRVTLVTHVRNRAGIATSDIGRFATVDFIDNEFVARPIYLLARAPRRQPTWLDHRHGAGLALLRRLRAHAREEVPKRLQRREFDLVHRVTPLSPTAVSRLLR